jgi:hypothetical protein
MSDEELLKLAESNLIGLTNHGIDRDRYDAVAQATIAASLLVIARSLKKPSICNWVPASPGDIKPEHKGADAIGKVVDPPAANEATIRGGQYVMPEAAAPTIEGRPLPAPSSLAPKPKPNEGQPFTAGL